MLIQKDETLLEILAWPVPDIDSEDNLPTVATTR